MKDPVTGEIRGVHSLACVEKCPVCANYRTGLLHY